MKALLVLIGCTCTCTCSLYIVCLVSQTFSLVNLNNIRLTKRVLVLVN